MAELIGGSGEVAVIAADQTGKSNVDRRDGFVNRMKEKYPNVKVVDIQYAPDMMSATDVAKTMIQSRKNLKAFSAPMKEPRLAWRTPSSR